MWTYIPHVLELTVWKKIPSKLIKVFWKFLSIVCQMLQSSDSFHFIYLSCSLADYWQTQSFCFHKELMKRTIGKPTYAFEARDYVVSLPVTARSYGHGTGTNPSDSTKTGDPDALWPGHWEKPHCIISTTGFFIWKKLHGKKKPNFPTAIKLPKNVSELSLVFPPFHWLGLLSETMSLGMILWAEFHP